MTAKPSGMPIPTPMAVGRLVDCFWVCAAAGGHVEVMTAEDAVMKIDFALGPREAEEAVVTTLLELSVGFDDESVRGGNPKTWPPV